MVAFAQDGVSFKIVSFLNQFQKRKIFQNNIIMFIDTLHNPFIAVYIKQLQTMFFVTTRFPKMLDCIRFNISNRLNTIAKFMSVADSFIVINVFTLNCHPSQLIVTRS